MLLPAALPAQQTIAGQAAFADWNQQQPGVRRKITLADLTEPKPDVLRTSHFPGIVTQRDMSHLDRNSRNWLCCA